METILVYKFPQRSRGEITARLGLRALKQTRVFQEFYEDGQRDGLEQGRQEGLAALEELAEALLDFQSLVDLQDWCEQAKQRA